MTASGFVAVLNACNQIQFSLESLSAQIAVFAENGTLIERFRTGENMEPEIEKKEPGQSAAPFEMLQVQDICFQYENNKFGLKNVRFEIKKGEKFDPMAGVSASDGNGNDITSRIQILKNNVKYDKEGVYEVIYSVKNDNGNTLQRTRKVEVIKNESEKKS